MKTIDFISRFKEIELALYTHLIGIPLDVEHLPAQPFYASVLHCVYLYIVNMAVHFDFESEGGSQRTYITFASAMRVRQPTLPLKPWRRHQKSQNRGTSGPKIGHVSAKNFFKKRSESGCH